MINFENGAPFDPGFAPFVYGFSQNAIVADYEIQKLVSENPSFKGSIESIPVETLRYAMAVIATIPVLLIFPSMQKYFSKGIAVGSVKG